MRAGSFVFALSLIASGCAGGNPASVLAPYAGVPTTCQAIDAELLALAEHDAAIYAARAIKEQTATGIGVAAAAGALPAGFAWAPLAAAGANQVRLPTHAARIQHLAVVREIRGCPPLEVAQ
jgi:hypothetical protein